MAHGHDSLPPSTGSVDGDKEDYDKTREKKNTAKKNQNKKVNEKNRKSFKVVLKFM
jgi:hypothetical protein